MMPSAFSPPPTLDGPTLRLRPLQPDDLEDLYRVAADPLFLKCFEGAIASQSALALVDRPTGSFKCDELPGNFRR